MSQENDVQETVVISEQEKEAQEPVEATNEEQSVQEAVTEVQQTESAVQQEAVQQVEDAELQIVTKRRFGKALWWKIAVVMIFVVTAVAIGTVAMARTDAEKVARYLELGDKYLDELKYEKAVAVYTNALKIDPKNTDAVCGLAEAYVGLEDNASAKKVLREYLDEVADGKYRSKQEGAYAMLADILYDEKDYNGAVNVIREAVLRIDSDKDTVPDYHEQLVGLNADAEDSNSDGIADGMLVRQMMLSDETLTDYNFLYQDSDGDGLSNQDEIWYGSNLFLKDSDNDGLIDYEEIYYHNTNPMLQDSDGDGLYDATEVEAGFDPTLEDSDGDGVSDGKTEFTRVVQLPSAPKSSDSIYPIVRSTTAGELYGKFDATAVVGNETLEGIGSKQGVPYEFVIQEETKQDISFGFCIPQNASAFYNNPDTLTIASYDYAENRMVFHDTQVVNQEDGSVLILAENPKAGTYMLVNYKRFQNDVDIEEESVTITSGKADIVFLLDITGSMSNPIDNVKSNIKTFTEYINEQGVDIRFGLVYFKDIFEDGPDSTEELGFYYDYEEFLEVMSDVEWYIGGGGDDPETVVDALDAMKQMSFRAGVDKFAIVITDVYYKDGIRGDDSYTMEQMIGALNSAGICTSVVTNDYYFDEYEALTEGTDGELCDILEHFIDSLTPLMDKIGTMAQTGCWIRLSNGCVVNLKEDPAAGGSVDTDGDGIADRDELGGVITVSYKDEAGKELSYKAYTFKSNPALADSDGDGYSDAEDKNPIRSDVAVAKLKKGASGIKVSTEDGEQNGVPLLTMADGTKLSSAIAAAETLLLYLQKSQNDYYYMTSVDTSGESCDEDSVRYFAENLMSRAQTSDLELVSDCLAKTKKLKKVFDKVVRKTTEASGSYVTAKQMETLLYGTVSGYGRHTAYQMPLALFDRATVLEQLTASAQKELPVLLQNGIGCGMTLYSDEDLKDAASSPAPGEWVIGLGYVEDAIKNTTVVQVLYDGKQYYVDFNQLMENGLVSNMVGLR